MSPSQDAGARGFTLLEVVVAMAIIGLGVVTLLEIFSSGLRLGARSSETTEAYLDAGRVMDEYLARRRITGGSEEGRLAGGGRWIVEAQPLNPDSDQLDLASAWQLEELTLRLQVPEAGRERRVELKTLRLVRENRR